mgnify:CR=1 FL=1
MIFPRMIFEILGGRILPVLKSVRPLVSINHPASREHRGRLIEVELIPHFKMEFLPELQWNGDLALGCDRYSHALQVRLVSKEFKMNLPQRYCHRSPDEHMGLQMFKFLG